MKKLLLNNKLLNYFVLLLLFVNASMNAQTVFEENFGSASVTSYTQSGGGVITTPAFGTGTD